MGSLRCEQAPHLRLDLSSPPNIVTYFKQFMQMTGVVAEVLFLSSPVTVGGLDLAPREMAILYIARPIMSSASNLLVYPFLTRRYRPEAIFRWGVTLNNTAYYGFYLAFGLYAAAHHPSHSLSLVLLFLISIPLCLNGSTATACTHTLTSRAPSKAYLARITTAQEYFANAAHGLGSECCPLSPIPCNPELNN